VISIRQAEVTDGIPYADHVGCYVQELFAFKDDHPYDNCFACREASSNPPDGFRCFASLGPVPDEVLDRWVKDGDYDFSDADWTEEGRNRLSHYWAMDRRQRFVIRGEKA
jgi:hypothetical protein